MNFYITTPIYYANAELHIGHGYTSVITDVLKRFHSLFGEESFFLTGMDEHGAKVEEAALAQGKTPQQLCDENYLKFVESLKTLGISYNHFIRTTSDRHKKGVQKLLTTLWNAKTPDGQSAIYQGKYEGLYCIGCEKFITEKELTPEGLCPNHLSKPKLVSENNWFFRLTSYLDKVEEHIRSGRIRIMPEGRRNEVLGLLKQGLNDFSISRERLNWGIDIPFDPSQKTYVWVDALPNYITAIGYGDDPEMFDKWWNKSQVVHLMGRDILKFHAIFWPALLMAAELRLPDIMFIHGYLSLNGQKISKSLGNVISNEHLVEKFSGEGELFGRDSARYLLASQFPFHLDGDISFDRLQEKYNSDLANDYGNLIQRVLKLVETHFEGRIPAPAPPSEHLVFDQTTYDLVGYVESEIRDINVLKAIEQIWNHIRATNQYFDHNKPWELAKQGHLDELGKILYRCLKSIQTIATLTWPIMPSVSNEVLSRVGYNANTAPDVRQLRDSAFLAPGTRIRLGGPLFVRIVIKPKPATMRPSTAGPTVNISDAQPSNKPADTELPEGIVTIDDFFKTKLVVAEVIACENVPETSKLLKLQIAIGEDKRQIVAGVAEYYKPEEMVGKKIVVVANLKPTKIRGIDSNGMLLAAKKGKELKLVTVDGDIPSGATVG